MPRRHLLASLLLLAVALAAGAKAWLVWREQARTFPLLAAVPPLPDLARWPAELRSRLVAAGEQIRTQPAASLRELALLYHANGFPAEARPALLALRRLEPAEPRWPYLLADLHLRNGDPAAAQPALEAALALAPDYARGWILLGGLLADRGDPAGAGRCFARALALLPDDLQAQFASLSFQALHARADADLLRRLAALDAAHPGVKPVLELLARVHEAAGHADAAARARDAATRAVLALPQPDPWTDELWTDCYDSNRLGLAGYKLIREKRLDEAARVLRRALALDPANPALHTHLAQTFDLRGDLPAARAVFEQAVAACPDDIPLRVRLAHACTAENNPALALSSLQTALARWPASGELHGALGAALRAARRPAEALPELRAALRLDPSLVEPYGHLAYCLAALDRTDEARAAARAALDRRPDYPEVLKLLGSLALNSGDPAAADAPVTRLYALAPDDDGARVLFAALQLMKGTDAAEAGQPDAAENFFRAGLAAQPDFLPLVRKAGLLAARRERWPDAIAHLSRSVAANPDPEACLQLGRAFAATGRPDEARAAWQRGLAAARATGDPRRAADLTRLLAPR